MTTRINLFHLSSFIVFLSFIIWIAHNVVTREKREKTDRIDWHDRELMKQDERRTGLGEHGVAAYLDVYPPESKTINETTGYNGHLSDKIALNRSLTDLRPLAYNVFHVIRTFLSHNFCLI